ncbi:D-alanyl-D-alanine carboxypeptidase family protein [Rhodophyticola porphyridii]|uniref:D-alanyl-D-alanine carboxypeptidase family protein n=1 Tax=Rhodophyticola porphyridii TaxID=1852017 RepID=UPI0026AD37EA
MRHRRISLALFGFIALLCVVLTISAPARAAPYAAMVMDARTGEVLHSRNADTRLHPASLTKMMTLYIAFEAVRLGEITMDTPVTISANAAAEPPSELGLRAGSRISLRYLVRAAAVRSANDAATAIGEAIEGSEAAFARRMNRTASALGMTRTTFRNAHGLTEEGHLSTARDMTVMGRRLFFDYPQYYNIFSRRSTDAGIATVRNTNRRFLDAYRGADGIKTGYTRAAGFNLVASAERGQERIIATVFGGQSTASRNQRIMELLDMGFARAPTRATIRRPSLPTYDNQPSRPGSPATLAVAQSIVPVRRPVREASPVLLAAIDAAVEDALEDAVTATVEAPAAEDAAATVAAPAEPSDAPAATLIAEAAAMEPAQPDAIEVAALTPSDTSPAPRPMQLTEVVARAMPLEPEVVTRASSTGSRLYGVSLGRYPTRHGAERLLLTTALAELGTFDEALRRVVSRSGGFEARFDGMTEDQAARACARLMARAVTCTTYGP